MNDDDPSPEFSLIISTIGPAERLRPAIASIVAQSFGSFEVIVVDQNETDHVRGIVEEFRESGKVRHTRSRVGLSRGRNAGLAHARGRIVGFPDDDCEYPPTLLAEVRARLLSHGDAAGICVRCCDHEGHDTAGRSDRRGGLITKANVWIRAVSVGMFLQTEAVRRAGGFDENIGLGSDTPYLSGEETDLLLTLISDGHRIYYDPMLNVFHPGGSSPISGYHIERSYAYGMGKGLVLRRHKYGKRQIVLYCAKPILGALVAMLRGNLALAKLRLGRARGRFDGWRSPLPSLIERR